MYQITIRNGSSRQILHSDNPNSSQRISEGKLKEYVGITPSLSMTVGAQNACYDMLHDRTTQIELKNTRTGDLEFEGYLLNAQESMTDKGLLRKKLTCEGFLGYLNDSIQMYRVFTGYSPSAFLLALLEQHNSTTEEAKHIYLGEVNISSAYIGTKTTEYRNTLAEIKANLVDLYGGELRVRRGADGRLYLDYLEAVTEGSTSDTVVMLGHNLRSLSIERDTTDIITRLIPLGAKLYDDSDERLTINPKKPYIDDDAAIAQYGVIVGTVIFDDIDVIGKLYTYGLNYLQKNNRVRKHYAASVLDISGDGSLRSGNTYRFRNKLMGLDENLRLLGRTVDILKPYTPDVEIGDRTEKITAITAKNQHLVDYEIPRQISATVQTAKDAASSMIRSATTGYVVMRPNEILIMDTDDVETATSVWRWNQGGLGYSHSDTPGEAYDGEYGTAITMNGQIVADYIAAGTMFADRIRGGTLTLGGVDDVNGEISVINASNGEVMHVNQYGLYMTDTGSGMRVTIANGRIYGSANGVQFSEINPAMTSNTGRGMLLSAQEIWLEADRAFVAAHYGTAGQGGTFSQAFTGTLPVVTDIQDAGGGAIRWTIQNLQFINGILLN